VSETNVSGPLVYVASRASVPERPSMWRRLRYEGWRITSTWIDESGEGETSDFAELWLRIQREIRDSHGLILYVEPDDFPLKGALIEVGMAIGMRKPIAIVAPGVTLDKRSCRPVGSWINHPACQLCDTLESARLSIERRA
jgi:hypothetical protein